MAGSPGADVLGEEIVRIRGDITELKKSLMDAQQGTQQAVKAIEGHTKKISQGFDESARGVRKGASSMISDITGIQESYIKWSVAATGTFVTIERLFRAAEEAAGFAEQKSALDGLASAYGTTADEIISASKKAAGGKLSIQETVSFGAKALSASISPESIGPLIEAADLISDRAQISIPEAFDKMIQAASRGRESFLQMHLPTANLKDAMAEQGDEADRLAKVHGNVEEIIRAVREEQDRLGESTVSTADDMAVLRAELADVMLDMKGLAARGFGVVALSVLGIAEVIVEVGNAIAFVSTKASQFYAGTSGLAQTIAERTIGKGTVSESLGGASRFFLQQEEESTRFGGNLISKRQEILDFIERAGGVAFGGVKGGGAPGARPPSRRGRRTTTTEGGGGSGEPQETEADRARRRAEETLADIQFQREMIGLSEREQAGRQATRRLGPSVTPDLVQQIQGAATELFDAREQEKSNKTIRETISALQDEVDALDEDDATRRIRQVTLQVGRDLSEDEKESIRGSIAALAERKEKLEAEAEATKRTNSFHDEATKIIESGLTPMERYTAETNRITEAYDEGLIPSMEDYIALLREQWDALQDSNEALDSVPPRVETISDMTNGMGQALRFQAEEMGDSYDHLQSAVSTLADGTVDAFTSMILEGENLADSMNGIMKAVVAEITKAVVQIMIVRPLIQGLQGAFGGVAPSADLGGTPKPFGGVKAEGGRVFPNTAFLVGERGPELFVPNSGGNIIPNVGLRNSSGGADSVTVNLTIQTGVQQTVRAEIAQMMPRISDAVASAVADKRMRGGSFSSAMGT